MMLVSLAGSSFPELDTRPVPIDHANPVPRMGDHLRVVGADGEFQVTKVVWAYDIGFVYVHFARPPASQGC
jgi:hypothetical protein